MQLFLQKQRMGKGIAIAQGLSSENPQEILDWPRLRLTTSLIRSDLLQAQIASNQGKRATSERRSSFSKQALFQTRITSSYRKRRDLGS